VGGVTTPSSVQFPIDSVDRFNSDAETTSERPIRLGETCRRQRHLPEGNANKQTNKQTNKQKNQRDARRRWKQQIKMKQF